MSDIIAGIVIIGLIGAIGYAFGMQYEEEPESPEDLDEPPTPTLDSLHERMLTLEGWAVEHVEKDHKKPA